MTYRITGLDPSPFRHLFGLSDEQLASRGVVRMPATAQPGFPCRVSLKDAEVGRSMLLLNHVNHDVTGPYRASHAIFVEEGAEVAGDYTDATPPVFYNRRLSLRGFDAAGMMADALIVEPGEADGGIRRLFDRNDIAYILAYNAVRGCFSARVERA